MTQDQQTLVMVVDDDPRSRELMSVILRHAGFGVTAAAHPAQAQALLDDASPALAIVDYLMPGMNGLEFCRWVRQQPSLATLRFVLLTGMDTAEIRAEAHAAGADDVVTKPFDRLEFLARLKSLLESPTAR
jgi:DNA-binding response OmpR family regulator